jgi:hypothetical protein
MTPTQGLRRRIAFGLSLTPRPDLVLIPLGLAIGPAGINLLSPPLLNFLDPAVAVGLAALGVYVGLGLNVGRPRDMEWLGAASLEAGLTMLLVGVGLFLAQTRSALFGPQVWSFTLAVSLAAAVSSPTGGDSPDWSLSLTTRVADLDAVLPIIFGGLLLASMRQGFSLAALWVAAQSGLIAVLIALAGWLLVAHRSAESEELVFVAGALLLLGGAAAYLAMSALWVGLVAGIVWNVAGGPARDRIDSHMRYLQHSLVVLVLLVAGARLEFVRWVPGLVAVYVVCRIAGKLAGGWVINRLVCDLPANLGRRLLAPGVMAVAFSLNVLQAGDGSDAATLLLAVTATASVAFEWLSVMAVRPQSPR